MFRTVVRQEMDFSGYLKSFSLETDRRSRDAADEKLIFCPKGETEKSIATLRIVKPKRFTSKATATAYLSATGEANKVGLDPTNRADTVREFEILLESTDFLLEDVQEQMAERFQLQETFSDFNVFFFGKRAEIFTYSGTLINAGKNLAWRNNFLYNYENYLRGTRCAELKARAYLLYDDVVREGFILSAAVSQNSAVEAAVKFNFTLLVTGKRVLTNAPENVAKSDFVELGTDAKSVTPEDFEFVKAAGDGSGLSWVHPTPSAAGLGEEPGEVEISAKTTFPDGLMIANGLIEEPPSDLKQAIINRSMEALKRNRASEEIKEEGQVLDYEVLIDFITARQLRSLPTTAAKLAGQKSTDVENQTGEVIVARLLSDPPLPVNDLRLEEAVKAAQSLAKQYGATIPSDQKEELERMANYFSSASVLRLSPLGPQVDFPKIVAPATTGADSKYVLANEIDREQIKDVISKTSNVRAFVAATVNKVVVDNSGVYFINALGGGTTAGNLVQWYAAAFCLIPDPSTGNLFAEVTSTLKNVATLDGKPNAVVYVQHQKINDFKKLFQVLPPKVSAAATSAVSEVVSKVGSYSVIDPILLSEGVIYHAQRDYGANPALCKYLSQVGVMVTAILGEAYDRYTMAKTDNTIGRTGGGVPPASVDMITATLKAGQALIGDKYFVKPYVDSLEAGNGIEPGSKIISFRYGNITEKDNELADLGGTPDGSGGLYLPLCYGVRTTRFVAYGEKPLGFTPVGMEIIVDDSTLADPFDRQLLKAGIVHLSADVVAKIGALNNRVYYVEATRRSGAPEVPGATKVVTSAFLGMQRGFRYQNAMTDSALNISEPIVGRNYSGGPILEYHPPTPGNIKNRVNVICERVPRIAEDVITQTVNSLTEIVTEPWRLSSPEFASRKDQVRSGLALSYYQGLAEVDKIDTDLKYTGVKTDNYLDLAFMAQIQKTMADNLVTLRDQLTSAVNVVRGGEVESADVVRETDKQAKEVSCG